MSKVMCVSSKTSTTNFIQSIGFTPLYVLLHARDKAILQNFICLSKPCF